MTTKQTEWVTGHSEPASSGRELTQVELDYLAGKWIPSYYGNRYSVAKKREGTQCEQDLSFIVKTFDESEAEAIRRNAQ